VFRSLRFRLPAIFLAGIALAGLVSTLLAIRLFQDYSRDQSVAELRREASGLVELYFGNVGRFTVTPQALERMTGDRIFYTGLEIDFPDDEPVAERNFRRVERLDAEDVPPGIATSETMRTFEFTPPGADRTYIAVSIPVTLEENTTFGRLIVAKPKAELRDRWLTLLRRLALAFVGGILVAGLLAWYLSRRITKPVLALAEAADQVAEGRYDVDIPVVPGDDEIGDLSRRFGQMAERLRQTEELERNFLMSVSHELRTPLTAIRGHVEALREGVVEDPALRAHSLDVIAAETGRLERLVGDVLDLAKLDAHRFTVLSEEVDMERLVDRAYATFGEEARRRAIDYRQEVRATPTITTDGDRVLQVITNLLANAFRWTPDGGRIGLELTAENGTVSVAVEDTGPGISERERERIFRPFWSRDGGGTGLGLAIARELAIALGGRIELDTAPGMGSRFLLVLPGGEGYEVSAVGGSARRSSMR
jgi:signal transduction histidine kinase